MAGPQRAGPVKEPLVKEQLEMEMRGRENSVMEMPEMGS
jgi:hypothetical protein